MVSHNMGDLREICDSALVLEGGSARYFDDLEEAIAAHRADMGLS
jgi:capsular polysaccharide transport system ATP-binding protein